MVRLRTNPRMSSASASKPATSDCHHGDGQRGLLGIAGPTQHQTTCPTMKQSAKIRLTESVSSQAGGAAAAAWT
jgi:hypothetical protein